jgi:putative ABC transport system permease protein
MRFTKLLPYVARTVRRARLRSTLTVLGAALALGLLAFVRTLEAGVARLSTTSSRPVLVVFQRSRFCALTSELPMRYKAELEAMEGVEAVLPTLVYVNACRSNLDLVTLHGVDPVALANVERLSVVAGDLDRWNGAGNGALIGRRLAERRRLSAGDAVRFEIKPGVAVDLTVSGIVEGEGPGLDNIAFVHEGQLQKARDLVGKTTEFLVRLAPGVDAGALARRIDERFRTDEAPTDTKTQQAFVQAAVGEVAGLVDFARLLGWIAVGVVVLILGNTVFISAQTRAQELGTLETIGVPKASLALALVAEGMLLALAGGFVGTGAVVGFFALHPMTLGVEGFGIDFVAGAPVMIAGLLASLVIGVVASAGPAIDLLLRPLALAVKPAA